MFQSQSGTGNFIFITTGDSAEIIVDLFIAFRTDGEGECIRTIDQLFRITLGTDDDKCHIFAPHNAKSAPGSGHSIGFPVFFGSDQKPVTADQFKYVVF